MYRLLLLFPLLFAACEERDGVRVYETTPVAAYDWPADAPTVGTAEGLAWDVPAGWEASEDVSDALLADYRLPGATEALPGRLTVSMIGGDAGGLDANIARWVDQLLIAQPRDLRGLVRVHPPYRHRIGTLNVVEIDGQYAGPTLPSAMRVAVLTILDPSGRPYVTWFFKLTGDAATVDGAMESLFRMAYSLRLEGEPPPQFDPPTVPGDAPDADPHDGVDGAPPLLRRPEEPAE